MRKPIDWGFEYGFVGSDGWKDMCWYAENGYQELPHFVIQFIKWITKRNVYFKINLFNKDFYLRKR